MPKIKIAWHRVPDDDFRARTNTDLAAALGCTPQNVARERRRRGLAAHRRGYRPGGRPAKPAFRLSRPAARTLRDLAAAAGLSPSAFILSFKSTAGATPANGTAAVHTPPAIRETESHGS